MQARGSGYNFWMNARILVTALALAGGMASGLIGCGQRGALYLPTEPAAQDRATLPQILTPSLPSRKPADTP
jgi:hypothetical protein